MYKTHTSRREHVTETWVRRLYGGTVDGELGASSAWARKAPLSILLRSAQGGHTC